MDVIDAVATSPDTSFKESFNAALECLIRTLDLYGPDGVAISFNGGKDSTVILHILRAAIQVYFSRQKSSAPEKGIGSVRSFVFERSEDFDDIRHFVQDMDRQHHLQLETLRGDFKPGLETFLHKSKIKAIILGTRRGDPNAEGQDMFCPSSRGYPPFMRVNPVLSWSYSEVWTFLRTTGVPYCRLYDQGFTSVGSITNTFPNSALKKEDGTFAAAHLLADSRLERAGRASRDIDIGGQPVSSSASLTRTAAIIIVGDEILNGKVGDTNTRFLCQELHAIGWHVAKVVVVPDERAVISAEVHAVSGTAEVVITSGGLGPTPDDVTMPAVADALNLPLTRNRALEERLRKRFGEEITAAHLKMAETPAGEVEAIDYTLSDGQPSPFPLIRCRNIYVLPGIPELLRSKWKVVRQCLLQDGKLSPFHDIVLRLTLADETSIAPALNNVAASFSGSVSVGSYPVSEESDGARILLALQGKDLQQLNSAAAALKEALPPSCVVAEEHDPPRLSHRQQSPGSARQSLDIRADRQAT
ncbi:hypothetical protein WJX73_002147 [Symbiochloris irregularis]|uniref:FAD synthase n=1 Tax=Symbiochloris irregularis TaxID=706552 RepID=A0AAW1PYF7_9CHLO